MATKQSLIQYYQQILDKNAKEQDQTSIESASSILIKEFIEKLQELQPTLADEELLRAIMKDLEQYLSANAFWDVHSRNKENVKYKWKIYDVPLEKKR